MRRTNTFTVLLFLVLNITTSLSGANKPERKRWFMDLGFGSLFYMGTDWQYKPMNDPHKTGPEIINLLIETRAKGGNLLLNVGA